MNNADLPAMPIQPTDRLIEMIYVSESNSAIDGYTEAFGGLTKREYFAGLAMQGLIASVNTNLSVTHDVIAKDAVIFADALLSELEKTK